MTKIINVQGAKDPGIGVSGMTQQELIESFADLQQHEVPTRQEVLEHKDQVKTKKRRIQMIPKNKKISQRRGHNLNDRIIQADKLWKNTWMSQRGVLLRHVGVQYEEEITALANLTECPQIVIDYFINHGGIK
jgi:hypothetical protein